jgi:membrane-bound metal-dependent hydrolase YbcI (DUF457 family)
MRSRACCSPRSSSRRRRGARRCGCGRRSALPRRSLPAAALAPDVDGVSILGGVDSFKAWHQIYTHNVIAFATAPPLIALAAYALTGRRFTYPRLLALFWLGMALHLAGDVIAQWPLRFLYPFSPTGWSFQLIPRDFSIGLALILMVVALAGYVDGVAPWRRVTAAAGLLAGVLYVTVGPGL